MSARSILPCSSAALALPRGQIQSKLWRHISFCLHVLSKRKLLRDAWNMDAHHVSNWMVLPCGSAVRALSSWHLQSIYRQERSLCMPALSSWQRVRDTRSVRCHGHMSSWLVLPCRVLISTLPRRHLQPEHRQHLVRSMLALPCWNPLRCSSSIKHPTMRSSVFLSCSGSSCALSRRNILPVQQYERSSRLSCGQLLRWCHGDRTMPRW